VGANSGDKGDGHKTTVWVSNYPTWFKIQIIGDWTGLITYINIRADYCRVNQSGGSPVLGLAGGERVCGHELCSGSFRIYIILIEGLIYAKRE
jgi:hypothetical protein